MVEGKQHNSRVMVDDYLLMEEKSQLLYSVVMHIDASKFLVTLPDPLQLTLVTIIEREL